MQIAPAAETGIEKAVRLAGSQTALGKLLDDPVSPQAVQKWVEKGFAPGDRCREIERKLNYQVTRYELNREVFGDPSEAIIPAGGTPEHTRRHDDPKAVAP
jgi:DNA-binding transcriptional regulator YdaS (Cro superfamily)